MNIISRLTIENCYYLPVAVKSDVGVVQAKFQQAQEELAETYRGCLAITPQEKRPFLFNFTKDVAGTMLLLPLAVVQTLTMTAVRCFFTIGCFLKIADTFLLETFKKFLGDRIMTLVNAVPPHDDKAVLALYRRIKRL